MRWIATALVVVGIGCFVLPFFAVTHQGGTLIHFTGLELLFGTTFHHQWQGTISAHTAPITTAWIAVGGLLVAGVASWSRYRRANTLRYIGALLTIFATLAIGLEAYFPITRVIPDYASITSAPARWAPLVCAIAILGVAIAQSLGNRPSAADAPSR
jgi:hypothetical protein